ncbi:MAG: hypothetical protein R3D85_10635 [Paracoccaceae bacterium]
MSAPLPHAGTKIVVPSVLGPQPTRPSETELSVIASCDITVLSELVGPMYTMDGSLQALNTPVPVICGPAITAKCTPGDNQAMVRALSEVRPGDVLVVDAQGFDTWCLGGEQLLTHARDRNGLAAVFVNGAYRDVNDLNAAGFPAFATAVAPYSGPKRGPGEVNVPVCCGRVVVQPGDIVSASAEGIVVVPQFAIESVASAVAERAGSGHHDIGGFIDTISAEFDAAAVKR